MRAALVGIFLATSACAEAPTKMPDPDSCGAPRMQYLMGQDEGALAAMTFEAGKLRVIRPGMPVTQDYSPERLNITVDADGQIIRVHCG